MLTPRERLWLTVTLIVVAVVRLATLGAYPLLDPTEARYAEIARKMLASGNWLTPQFAVGVPFWGKPPLSMWLSAASMGAFGVNEFAARLPSLLLVASCGGLVWLLARLRDGRDAALCSLVVFATTAMVFIAAGAVMTDAALALGTTLAMAGFWVAVDGPPQLRRGAGLAFFGGLAVGLLAKGPVALVLTVIPVGAWTLRHREWRTAWISLPWVTGLLLAAALVVPWYWAAERATPGFLRYFLIGEHLQRFLVPGWKGDLYGEGHAQRHGTILVFWIAAALPWSIPAISWLVRSGLRRRAVLRTLVVDRWQSYLLFWTLAPMLFFTLSGNVLATYVLPGLPGFALLTAALWRRQDDASQSARLPVRQGVAAGMILATAFVGVILAEHRRLETVMSQKALVHAYETRRSSPDARLVYLAHAPISAEFYSQGGAIKVPDFDALAPYLADATMDFIVVRSDHLDKLPPAARARLASAGGFGRYRLLYEDPQSAAGYPRPRDRVPADGH